MTTVEQGQAAGTPPWRRIGLDWLPALIGAVAVWIAIGAIAGQGLVGTVQQALTVASFLALVGLGQLFVISVGSGNIDLSVPYTMTLSAYVIAIVMNGSDAGLIGGLAAAVGIGVGVGVLNALVIAFLKIPPLVATLASGFILLTVVQVIATGGARAPSPALVAFASGGVGGFTFLAVLVLLLAVGAHVLLAHGRYGRKVLATGQSARAATLAGISTFRVTTLAYVLCGVAASLCGFLLGGYSNGPSLDMADPYQLGAIAVVVLGGTAINGGRANVIGVWAAAMLLTMLSTLVNILGAGGGVQRIVEGAVIVGVLALMPSRKGAR